MTVDGNKPSVAEAVFPASGELAERSSPERDTELRDEREGFRYGLHLFVHVLTAPLFFLLGSIRVRAPVSRAHLLVVPFHLSLALGACDQVVVHLVSHRAQAFRRTAAVEQSASTMTESVNLALRLVACARHQSATVRHPSGAHSRCRRTSHTAPGSPSSSSASCVSHGR